MRRWRRRQRDFWTSSASPRSFSSDAMLRGPATALPRHSLSALTTLVSPPTYTNTSGCCFTELILKTCPPTNGEINIHRDEKPVPDKYLYVPYLGQYVHRYLGDVARQQNEKTIINGYCFVLNTQLPSKGFIIRYEY